MTSLKRHFLKNFPTKCNKIFRQGVKLMSNKVLKVWWRYLTISYLVLKLSRIFERGGAEFAPPSGARVKITNGRVSARESTSTYGRKFSMNGRPAGHGDFSIYFYTRQRWRVHLHVRTRFPYLGNGWEDCVEIWCVVMDPLDERLGASQSWGASARAHVHTTFPYIANGWADCVQI